MIQVGAHAFAIDDSLSIVEPVKIRAVCPVVQTVRFLGGQPGPRYSTTRAPFRIGAVVKTPAAWILEGRMTNVIRLISHGDSSEGRVKMKTDS